VTRPAIRALRAVVDNAGFVCITFVACFCIAHAFDPPRLNWGDPGTDYNVLAAGRNFQQYGFLKLHLTSHLLDPALITTPQDRVFIYTHYPQLPELINGVLRVAFGMSDLVQFRFFALVVSFASLFFIYSLIRLYWSRQTAQIAIALWVANPLWIQHADYLHHVPYGAFFGFGSVYFLTRYLREGQRPGQLALAGVLLTLTYMSSYDWWFFGPLLLALATVAHYGKLFTRPALRVLGILAACAIAGVLFKLATNAWGLGGIDALLRDLRFQFTERATDRITNTDYRLGMWPTLYGRTSRFATILLFPVTAFWLLFPIIRRRAADRLPAEATSVVNPIWLLVAALPFLTLFAEMWIAQYYPAVLVIPFYAVGSAAIAVMLFQARSGLVKTAGGILILVLLANSLDENLTFKPAFFARADIASLATRLAAEAPADKQILVNHNFDGLYRNYFGRKIYGLTLVPPRVADHGLVSLSDPAVHPEIATAQGALFVQHKRVVDELYDKGYYYIFARYRLWDWWGNPRKYHAQIDSMMRDRDSTLMAHIQRMGRKLDETDAYVLWRIPPGQTAISR
jgi:hypothetical protein